MQTDLKFYYKLLKASQTMLLKNYQMCKSDENLVILRVVREAEISTILLDFGRFFIFRSTQIS